jgi:hypothetical protein
MLAGTYACVSGCAASNASVYIEVYGRKVVCTNEAGVVSYGKFTSSRRISCFDGGLVSNDQRTIRWADGKRWAKP